MKFHEIVTEKQLRKHTCDGRTNRRTTLKQNPYAFKQLVLCDVYIYIYILCLKDVSMILRVRYMSLKCIPNSVRGNLEAKINNRQ